jgi:PST family polysaccharide transporter
LGFAFMASGVCIAAAAYAARAILLYHLDLASAGLYQAAWTLAGLYVGFVLQAMGTDFYPRLVAGSNDAAEMNRLVNEQAEVSMLLALPGVIATIALAQPLLAAIFSHRFDDAAGVLRWLCVGMALRVFTWPMGYIVVAKGRQLLFLSLDLLWATAATALAWACVGAFGIEGSGVAFLGAYLLHALVLLSVARRLTGFQWTRANANRAVLGALLVAGAVGAFAVLSEPAAMLVALVIALSCTAGSVHALMRLMPTGRVPPSLSRMLALRRSAPVATAPLPRSTPDLSS